MQQPKEPARHYPAGSYTCPVLKVAVELEADVPRPWVEWPVRVHCKECGGDHLLQYDDVQQHEPVFGHE